MNKKRFLNGNKNNLKIRASRQQVAVGLSGVPLRAPLAKSLAAFPCNPSCVPQNARKRQKHKKMHHAKRNPFYSTTNSCSAQDFINNE